AGSAATIGTGIMMATPAMADPKRVLWLMGGVVAVVTVPSFLVYWTTDLAVAKLCLWMLVPAMYFYIGPSFALINNVVPAQMRATASAVTVL
ncbi:hypothetical protein, partial [Salmonella enterica]|uniref:hypothetical protein n=1 Tax=Salmonella enterica TaxID=28901 RepID=UPI003D2C6581